MTELLLKDQLELQKRAAERTEWDRIANLQVAIATLTTRFDDAMERIRERLGDAVSDEDLKDIKLAWESALRDANATMRDAIAGIREHFSTANDQQSSALLGQVELMLARDRQAAEHEAKKTRQQFNFVILGAVLSILGGLFLFWETSKLH